MYHIHRTVHIVRTYIDGKVRIHSILLHLGNKGIDFGLVLNGSNLFQFRFNRSDTFFVKLYTIHRNVIQITHFLCYATGFVLGSSQFFDKAAKLFAVVFGKHVERAET